MNGSGFRARIGSGVRVPVWDREPFDLPQDVTIRVLYLTDVSVAGTVLGQSLVRMLNYGWEEPTYGYLRLCRWGDRGLVVLVIKRWYSIGHAQGVMHNLLLEASSFPPESYTAPGVDPGDDRFGVGAVAQYIERFPSRHVRLGHIRLPRRFVNLRYWRWVWLRVPEVYVQRSVMSLPMTDRMFRILRATLVSLLSRRYVPNMRMLFDDVQGSLGGDA